MALIASLQEAQYSTYKVFIRLLQCVAQPSRGPLERSNNELMLNQVTTFHIHFWVCYRGGAQGRISHLSCTRFQVHLLASAGTFSTSIMSRKTNRLRCWNSTDWLMMFQCHYSPERLWPDFSTTYSLLSCSYESPEEGGRVYLSQLAAGVCPKESNSPWPVLPLQIVVI